MEGDAKILLMKQGDNTFQSTPSAWRETAPDTSAVLLVLFQSTPSAWRETFRGSILCLCFWKFQSTPSAWRETSCWYLLPWRRMQFQSTPSAWRETSPRPSMLILGINFNPLPPHGGRLCPACDDLYNIFIFQSTPSAWRETTTRFHKCHRIIISIHSLRMEGDSVLRCS